MRQTAAQRGRHTFEPADPDLGGAFLVAEDPAPYDYEAPWWLADDFYPGDAADEAMWRAGLPDDVRADYDSGPYTGEGEVIPPGFTHHDHGGPSGVGFAAGGALDRLEPGPLLAEMLVAATTPIAMTTAATTTAATTAAATTAAATTAAATTADGYTQLGESELVGVLCAWRRMSSWSAAGEAAAVATLARRRAQQGVQRENRHLDEHVPDEIAAALTLTGMSALRLLEIAHGLRRLPEVYGALLGGQIDWAKACVFVDELAALDDAEARRLAALLLGAASGLTTGQLRRRLRLLVLSDHPEAAQDRKREARKDTRVEVWDEPSGNAALAGRQLQSADVIAIDTQLTATAEWLQSQGADGTIGQLRAAAYTALLAGRGLSTLLPDPADPRCGDSGPDSSGYGDSSGGSSARDDEYEGDLPDDEWRSDARGDDPRGDDPRGDYPRDGDAFTGHAADGGARDGRAGEGGADDGHARDRAAHGGDAGAAPGRNDRSGVVWPRLTGRINLTMPLSAWAGLSDKAGEAAGYGPQDASTCRDLAGMTDTKTRWCLTLTDEQGHAVAHACARDGPSHGERAIRWAKGLRRKLEYLQAGSCSHVRQSAAYRPPDRLAHLVRIRQQTCSYRGCRRAAARCDLDHTVAYDDGGRTCECNLAPLCRRHHRAKQAARWHLTQDQPGVMVWTLPSGRTYGTCPEPYPV